MSRRGRRGLRWRPPGGWPLDNLLVGVATLRTTRELFLQHAQGWTSPPPRAWDLSLWSGVTPKGSADSLERLRRVGLVRAIPPVRPPRAHGFSIEWGHPLTKPLAHLLYVEERMVQKSRR